MKFLSFSGFGIAILLFFIVVFLINKSVQADNCCLPPPRVPQAARFQQNARVTVYLDKRSGFTDIEIKAIKEGLEDWNDEPNNSGVEYTVVETDNLPTPGANNTVIGKFVNSPGSHEAQLNLSDQRTTSGVVTNVSGTLTFWNNIRSGNPSMLPGFLRATARHEGGHGLGLENSDSNGCAEGSNIMFPSRNQETFITKCDNDIIKTDSVYPSPTPTPLSSPTSSPVASPTPCAEQNQLCAFAGDCCPGLTCGELSNTCIPCELDPHNPRVGCTSETCANCYAQGGTHCDTMSGNCWTPVLVDVNGDGLRMTDSTAGIRFDGFGRGVKIQTAWTVRDSDDAWLALDRNNNGMIDDGTELFSSAAPQSLLPFPQLKNGFNALEQFDKPERGGNADGAIDKNDYVFEYLKLWQDLNHNGISEPSELSSLPALGLAVISLDYKEARRIDRHGNTYRYRAKVTESRSTQLGRWAWDVFPLAHP